MHHTFLKIYIRRETSSQINGLLLVIASRPALGPKEPPIQWVQGSLSQGVNRQGREADQSLSFRAEVNEWSYTSSPRMCSWNGAELSNGYVCMAKNVKLSLFLTKYYAMKTYGGVDIYIHAFLH
jgi:hypothetical protein